MASELARLLEELLVGGEVLRGQLAEARAALEREAAEARRAGAALLRAALEDALTKLQAERAREDARNLHRVLSETEGQHVLLEAKRAALAPAVWRAPVADADHAHAEQACTSPCSRSSCASGVPLCAPRGWSTRCAPRARGAQTRTRVRTPRRPVRWRG